MHTAKCKSATVLLKNAKHGNIKTNKALKLTSGQRISMKSYDITRTQPK